MQGCVFMTTGDATYGFSLAGFRQVITDNGMVAADFEKIVQQGEAGLVIVDERLLTEKTLVQLNGLERRWEGAMVVLPAPGEEKGLEGGDYGSRLIQRVLGYQMKLT